MIMSLHAMCTLPLVTSHVVEPWHHNYGTYLRPDGLSRNLYLRLRLRHKSDSIYLSQLLAQVTKGEDAEKEYIFMKPQLRNSETLSLYEAMVLRNRTFIHVATKLAQQGFRARISPQYLHTCSPRVYMHACILLPTYVAHRPYRIHTCMHACIQTYITTHSCPYNMHTYIQTYIYTSHARPQFI